MRTALDEAAPLLAVEVNALKIRDHVLSGPMAIRIPESKIHLLRGPNGCGKSLLLDTLSGVVNLPGVAVTLRGGRLARAESFARWRGGIRRMFQTPVLPGDATVSSVWDRACNEGRFGAPWEERARALLDACNLHITGEIGALSFGQRRALDLIFSLSSGTAHLLDEPFAGMRVDAIPYAIDLIRHTAQRGNGVLIVDHTAESRPSLFDAVHDWVPAEAALVTGSNLTIRKHVGATPLYHTDMAWRIEHLDIGGNPVANGLELDLPAGTAIICEGGNGTGKSTLLRALAAVPQPWPGVNAEIDARPQDRLVHLSPQPPKLVADLTVSENLSLMLGAFGAVPRDRIAEAHSLLRDLGLEPRKLNRRAEVLSGGEAAMIALVGAVLSPWPVLLLDEPFESLAPGVLPLAINLLSIALSRGKSALVVTHDPEVIHEADSTSVLMLTRGKSVSGRVVGSPLRCRSP